MNLEVQAQLVGALDTGSFMRVGGSAPVNIDVRVVAATQRDLHRAVEDGKFREDLFYQLNVVPLAVPPLREHREDIPELLDSAVDHLVEQDKLPYRRFSIAAQNVLRNHPWPGNIRELKNLVQRVLILGTGDEISATEVEAAMGAAHAASGAAGIPGVSFDQPLRDARDAFEKAYLEYQLEKHGGNVSQMAEEAGMERTHLYRKLRDRGIEIKDRR
jgi:DNA-binding NtrC family response regulator